MSAEKWFHLYSLPMIFFSPSDRMHTVAPFVAPSLSGHYLFVLEGLPFTTRLAFSEKSRATTKKRRGKMRGVLNEAREREREQLGRNMRGKETNGTQRVS